MSIDVTAASEVCTSTPKRWHKVGVVKTEEAPGVVAAMEASTDLPVGRWSWVHRASADGIGLSSILAMYCEPEGVEAQRIYEAEAGRLFAEHDAKVQAERAAAAAVSAEAE